ncbi:thioredoxin family protein [Rathayibacter caricis]|uniref:thioredoxin family protein n=1 Tax=Rathayibacter caricis TaxID=110936 RepID=UPI001FB32165|nr:thioredoxin family protein [Rathayibacter caricis]MCJ1697949.1 thioredoxin family protein [Rathayibacter caricis]
MMIEVLHIDDCPNWKDVGPRLEEALATTGHSDVPVTYRLLATSEDAADVAFAGSPTITFDGEDLFPSAWRATDLACRIYFTPDGLAGLPTTEQLVEAIASREP